MSELEVEYRWLLFDHTSREAYFEPNYDLRNSPKVSCYGLYAFPPRTILCRFPCGSHDLDSAIGSARKWAEEVCIPMRRAMPRSEWEELVRSTAYDIWLENGKPEGKDEEYWNAAAEQLADLLTTEYVFVKFEQPEAPDGLNENDPNSNALEPEPSPLGSSGSCKCEGAREADRCNERSSGHSGGNGLYAYIKQLLFASQKTCSRKT